MTDAKKVFEQGISYIKRELIDKEEELKEYEEYFSYMSKITLLQKKRLNRVLDIRYNEYLDLKNSIRHLRDDLKYFKDKFGYTDLVIDSIKPATDEQIKADEEQDLQDIKKENKSYPKKREKMLYNLKLSYQNI